MVNPDENNSSSQRESTASTISDVPPNVQKSVNFKGSATSKVTKLNVTSVVTTESNDDDVTVKKTDEIPNQEKIVRDENHTDSNEILTNSNEAPMITNEIPMVTNDIPMTIIEVPMVISKFPSIEVETNEVDKDDKIPPPPPPPPPPPIPSITNEISTIEVDTNIMETDKVNKIDDKIPPPPPPPSNTSTRRSSKSSTASTLQPYTINNVIDKGQRKQVETKELIILITNGVIAADEINTEPDKVNGVDVNNKASSNTPSTATATATPGIKDVDKGKRDEIEGSRKFPPSPPHRTDLTFLIATTDNIETESSSATKDVIDSVEPQKPSNKRDDDADELLKKWKRKVKNGAKKVIRKVSLVDKKKVKSGVKKAVKRVSREDKESGVRK